MLLHLLSVVCLCPDTLILIQILSRLAVISRRHYMLYQYISQNDTFQDEKHTKSTFRLYFFQKEILPDISDRQKQIVSSPVQMFNSFSWYRLLRISS